MALAEGFSQGAVWLYLEILGIVFLLVSLSTTAEEWRNLAQGKPAVQSSTGSHGGVASRAVDGKRSPDFNDNSCSETRGGNFGEPWWVVDLGQPYLISEISLTNRDIFPERLSKFSIEVSLYRDTSLSLISPHLCHRQEFQQAAAVTVFYPCPQLYVARYVRVSRYVAERLCLCEVEVIGTEYQIFQYLRSRKDKKAKGGTLVRQITASGVLECAGACAKTTDCSSLNLLKIGFRKVLCELIEDPIPWKPESEANSDGWIHYVPRI